METLVPVDEKLRRSIFTSFFEIKSSSDLDSKDSYHLLRNPGLRWMHENPPTKLLETFSESLLMCLVRRYTDEDQFPFCWPKLGTSGLLLLSEDPIADRASPSEKFGAMVVDSRPIS